MKFVVFTDALKAYEGHFETIVSLELTKVFKYKRIFSSMDYKNNDLVENDSSALIVFITIIAVAVSLLGIMVSMK